MRIYDMFMENNCEEIIERTMFTCGHFRDYEVVDDYNMEVMFEEFEGTLANYIRHNMMSTNTDKYDAVKIEGKNLIAEIHVDSKCTDCEHIIERRVCINTPRPQGFEDMVFMHGICALSRTDITQGIKHIVKVLTDATYETCCSSECIGPVGIALKGEVITASNIDLFTRVGEDGHRYYDVTKDNEEYIIYDAKDMAPNEFGVNDEFVTINNELQYVWYDPREATEEEREASLWLADKLGVEAIEIDANDKNQGIMIF